MCLSKEYGIAIVPSFIYGAGLGLFATKESDGPENAPWLACPGKSSTTDAFSTCFLWSDFPMTRNGCGRWKENANVSASADATATASDSSSAPAPVIELIRVGLGGIDNTSDKQ